MAQAVSHGSRAEKTRAAVLEAAEALFAERGFDATRLEDIAARVGIRRASIVYYFKDKRVLYEAVLDGVFGGLFGRVEAVLSTQDPLPERIEAAVSVWVDYVGSRPSLARILLREAANVAPGRGPALLRHTRPFIELIMREIMQRPDYRETKLAPIDPVHIASAVAGATIFFVAATPALVPELDIDPLSPERIEIHKREVLKIVRRLLGTRGPREVPS